MKLAIIIPFKSKTVSKSWDCACQSLYNSLLSIKNQTNSSYLALIVGHEKPEKLDDYLSDNILFTSVNFPPPDKNSSSFDILDYSLDKNKKIALGVQYLIKKKEKIGYWYQLDSDDLLSHNFVETILTHTPKPGFIIEHGYFYYQKQKRLIPENNLSVFCGSVLVIADEHMTKPQVDLTIVDNVTRKNISVVPWCRYAHFNYYNFFIEELSTNATVINKKLLCYVLANGHNISDARRNKWIIKLKQFLKPYIKGIRINKELSKQFSIL